MSTKSDYKPGRPASTPAAGRMEGVSQHKQLAMGAQPQSRHKVEQTKGGFQRKK